MVVHLNMESGEKHRRCTITDDTVRSIRKDFASGMSGSEGSKKYDIAAGTFCAIGSKRRRRLPEDDIA